MDYKWLNQYMSLPHFHEYKNMFQWVDPQRFNTISSDAPGPYLGKNMKKPSGIWSFNEPLKKQRQKK
jgi:hypothetical protein